MKKFCKFFGIASLAFATLTAGVLGLSGCGEKWKNPDKTPDPENPPIIVTPPEEEVPLISAISLKEIETYFKRPDVKLTFDTFKVTSGANSFDFTDDIKGMEFSASVDVKNESKNMVAKITYKDDHTETNYVTSTEPALFVLIEKAGENPSKRKFVEGEEFNLMLDDMNMIYEGAHDITPSFEDIKTLSTSPEVLEFDYSAVKKSLDEEVSYEINLEYNAWEDIESVGGIVRVKAYYEIDIVYNFSNNEIHSVTSSCTRTEEGSVESITSVVDIEGIEFLSMPTDFDTYPIIDELTLEEVEQYLSDSSVVSTFDGVDVKVVESDSNSITLAERSFASLKEGENFKAISKNVAEVDDKTYFISNGKVMVLEGTAYSEVTNLDDVERIVREHTLAHQNHSDAKVIFSAFKSDLIAGLQNTLSIVKQTIGNVVEIEIRVSYKTEERLESGETANIMNWRTLKFVYIDGKIQSVEVHSEPHNLDNGEILTITNSIASRIDTLDFPEFSTAPEGGEESGSEGETEGGNEGGDVVGGEEHLPEAV